MRRTEKIPITLSIIVAIGSSITLGIFFYWEFEWEKCINARKDFFVGCCGRSNNKQEASSSSESSPSSSPQAQEETTDDLEICKNISDGGDSGIESSQSGLTAYLNNQKAYIRTIGQKPKIESFECEDCTSLDLSPDGKILSYGQESDLVLRSLENSSEERYVLGEKRYFLESAWSPNGNMLYVITRDITCKTQYDCGDAKNQEGILQIVNSINKTVSNPVKISFWGDFSQRPDVIIWSKNSEMLAYANVYEAGVIDLDGNKTKLFTIDNLRLHASGWVPLPIPQQVGNDGFYLSLTTGLETSSDLTSSLIKIYLDGSNFTIFETNYNEEDINYGRKIIYDFFRILPDEDLFMYLEKDKKTISLRDLEDGRLVNTIKNQNLNSTYTELGVFPKNLEFIYAEYEGSSKYLIYSLDKNSIIEDGSLETKEGVSNFVLSDSLGPQYMVGYIYCQASKDECYYLKDKGSYKIISCASEFQPKPSIRWD